MQIRIFTTDENGFIKIRPDDFEILLNDAYMEGYNRNSLIIDFQRQQASEYMVYETWLEFIKRFKTGESKSVNDLVYWMRTTSIPSGIAQKLGIEPKKKCYEEKRVDK